MGLTRSYTNIFSGILNDLTEDVRDGMSKPPEQREAEEHERHGHGYAECENVLQNRILTIIKIFGRP